MLSRALWIGLAVLALVGGLLFQNRFIFARSHDGPRGHVIEASISDRIESRIADKMTVVSADGRRIEIPRETKQAMARAVSELIAAKTELAMLRVRRADPQEIDAAESRSDAAEARIEQVKSDIDRQRHLSQDDRDALRTQIQQDVREAVRESIRN